MHWHPNADEWQYWIKGQGRMTVFNAGPRAQTIDFRAGDLGVVPKSQGHYIENTGDEEVQVLVVFKAPGIPGGRPLRLADPCAAGARGPAPQYRPRRCSPASRKASSASSRAEVARGVAQSPSGRERHRAALGQGFGRRGTAYGAGNHSFAQLWSPLMTERQFGRFDINEIASSFSAKRGHAAARHLSHQ